MAFLSSNLYSQHTVARADDLFTSTLLNYMPELTEQVFNDFVTLSWLKNNGNLLITDGGERISEPLVKSKNTTAAFYSLYETLDVTPVTPLTSALYEWDYCSPIRRN